MQQRTEGQQSGSFSVSSNLASVVNLPDTLTSLVPDLVSQLSQESHTTPHGHLSGSLEVSAIVVIDHGVDLAPVIKKVCKET